MESTMGIWLSCLTLTAITLAYLLFRLQRKSDVLTWVLLLYFCLCFTFIVLKWCLRLDLAMYDSEKYQIIAAQIAGLLRADFLGNLPYILKPYAAYTLPLGLLYFIFGVSGPLGQILNTVVGLGLILNLHRLACLWFNRRVADRAALVVALYPYYWVLSGTLNRDVMIVFCISLFFRALTELGLQTGRGSSQGLYLTLLASFLYMGLLRPPLLILGALALFVYWTTHQAKGTQRRRILRVVRMTCIILVLGLGSAIFLLFGQYYTATSQLEQQATQFSDVGNMNQRLRISGDAGSAYLKGVTYSSYLEVAKVMPLATFYFMFSPLPWQVQSPKQALGLLDSFWLMLVYWYFLKGIKDLYHGKRKPAMALLAFLAVGIALSSVLQANVGSAMRHRPMFTLLMFPVAVHGLGRARRRQPKKAGVFLPGSAHMGLPQALSRYRG